VPENYTQVSINDLDKIQENKNDISVLKTDVTYMKEDLMEIKDSIKVIKNNHLAHIQKAMEGIRNDVNNIKVDLAKLSPINTLVLAVIQAVIIGIIMVGINLLLK